jgi:hypothetical protein
MVLNFELAARVWAGLLRPSNYRVVPSLLACVLDKAIVAHIDLAKVMWRGALLLVILQFLLSLACCQDDSATVLSQDTSSSSYEGEKIAC